MNLTVADCVKRCVIRRCRFGFFLFSAIVAFFRKWFIGNPTDHRVLLFVCLFVCVLRRFGCEKSSVSALDFRSSSVGEWRRLGFRFSFFFLSLFEEFLGRIMKKVSTGRFGCSAIVDAIDKRWSVNRLFYLPGSKVRSDRMKRSNENKNKKTKEKAKKIRRCKCSRQKPIEKKKRTKSWIDLLWNSMKSFAPNCPKTNETREKIVTFLCFVFFYSVPFVCLFFFAVVIRWWSHKRPRRATVAPPVVR